jgi:hypothetical protein
MQICFERNTVRNIARTACPALLPATTPRPTDFVKTLLNSLVPYPLVIPFINVFNLSFAS